MRRRIAGGPSAGRGRRVVARRRRLIGRRSRPHALAELAVDDARDDLGHLVLDFRCLAGHNSIDHVLDVDALLGGDIGDGLARLELRLEFIAGDSDRARRGVEAVLQWSGKAAETSETAESRAAGTTVV